MTAFVSFETADYTVIKMVITIDIISVIENVAYVSKFSKIDIQF